MKNFLLTIAALAITTAGVNAQEAFFPTKEGTKLLYSNKNKKGKIEGYVRYTVLKVEGSGENLVVTYAGQVLDKNGKASGDTSNETLYSATIRNGDVELDMKSFVSADANVFMNDVSGEATIEVTGDKLRIPATLAPGDKLDDVNFAITLMGFKIDIAMTDLQCLAVEEVTVPAGIFKCHKITQTDNISVMGQTLVANTVTWHAPGIGQVKTKTESRAPAQRATIELISIENQ